MLIQVLSVDVKTIPTAKGSYQKAEVAYKNLTFQGKVEGRGIMSFGVTASTFKVLASSTSGDIFEVDTVKNDKGFVDWLSATPSVAGAPTPAPASTGGKVAATGSVPARSSYETPDERSAKQLYIIRQSNISSAINLLNAGNKSTLKVAEVLEVAKQLENYVLGVAADTSGFDTMTDDVDVI